MAVNLLNVVGGGLTEKLSVDPVLETEAAGGTTCDVLLKRIERSNNWLDAFNVLIFLIATAAAAMLVVAILNAADEKYAQTAVAGVSAILASGAFAALLKLKKSQQQELDKYVRARKQHGCP